MSLTAKQREYCREAHHRWNLAVGAVRSGKSFMAVQHTIPSRLRALHGMKGIDLILGATKENIERNVLVPMRGIWGDALVSPINSRNQATLFGEQVYCIGAENAGQVSKIRGSEVKFCYCDELADINPEVFDILKSRLSLPYSEFHGACNPAGPRHFVKRFIDSAEGAGIDLWCQHYTIWDNPHLSPAYVRSLEAEYRGTVYYSRYIEGLWTQAEGLVYPNYGQALEDPYDGEVSEWCVSCDYGTQNAFAAILWCRDPRGTWHAVRLYYYSGRAEGEQKTDGDYVADMVSFCRDVPGAPMFVVDPSAASFIAALRRIGRFTVVAADNAVSDGIRDTASAMQLGLVRIGRNCTELLDELAGYTWDPRRDDEPVKADDHACDALRYFVRTRRVHAPQPGYRSIFDRRAR